VRANSNRDGNSVTLVAAAEVMIVVMMMMMMTIVVMMMLIEGALLCGALDLLQ
jgi:hypothetical protein